MNKRTYQKYFFPLLSFVLVWGISNYFNRQKVDVPYLHLADVQYTHLALTENLKKGNGSVFAPKSYVLDPTGGSEVNVKESSGDARFPLVHKMLSFFSFSDIAGQVKLWRVATFLFFLMAIYFSSLLTFDLTSDWLISFVISLGVNFTAVLFFAQWSVGTSVIVYALLVSGLYFSQRFLSSGTTSSGVWAVVTLGLGSLQGHGSYLYLLVFCFLIAYRCFKTKLWGKNFLIIIALSPIFLGLLAYNRFYLNYVGGGFFELDSFPGMFKGGLLEKNGSYLEYHGANVSNLFISVSLFLSLFFIVFNYINKRKINVVESSFFLLIGLIFSFEIVYYFSNLTGLLAYDIYALESYLPVFSVISIFAISRLYHENLVSKVVVRSGLVILLFLSTYFVVLPYEKKFVRSPDDRIQNTVDNFENASVFLDSLGVPSDAKIIVLNGYGGDLSLMKTGRYGYTPYGNTRADFKRVLDNPESNYVLSQDEYFMFDVVNVYPEALGKLSLVGSNEQLSLFKKVSNVTSGSVLKDYVVSHNKEKYLEAYSDFERQPADSLPGLWTYQGTVEKGNSYSGEYSMYVPREVEYPCTYRIKIKEFKDFTPVSAIVSSNLFAREELWKVCYTLSVHRNDTQLYNNTYKVSKKLKGDALNEWCRVSCKSTLPLNLQPGDEIRAYLWSPLNGELFVDDFSIMFY